MGREEKIHNQFPTRPQWRNFKRKNNTIVAAMYAMYLKGPDGTPYALERVAKVYRKSRQAVKEKISGAGT